MATKNEPGIEVGLLVTMNRLETNVVVSGGTDVSANRSVLVKPGSAEVASVLLPAPDGSRAGATVDAASVDSSEAGDIVVAGALDTAVAVITSVTRVIISVVSARMFVVAEGRSNAGVRVRTSVVTAGSKAAVVASTVCTVSSDKDEDESTGEVATNCPIVETVKSVVSGTPTVVARSEIAVVNCPNCAVDGSNPSVGSSIVDWTVMDWTLDVVGLGSTVVLIAVDVAADVGEGVRGRRTLRVVVFTGVGTMTVASSVGTVVTMSVVRTCGTVIRGEKAGVIGSTTAVDGTAVVRSVVKPSAGAIVVGTATTVVGEGTAGAAAVEEGAGRATVVVGLPDFDVVAKICDGVVTGGIGNTVEDGTGPMVDMTGKVDVGKTAERVDSCKAWTTVLVGAAGGKVLVASCGTVVVGTPGGKVLVMAGD